MNLIPVTLWYRIIGGRDGVLLEEYNHYEDGHVNHTTPTPKGETKFSGKWKARHGYRTNELVPKLAF